MGQERQWRGEVLVRGGMPALAIAPLVLCQAAILLALIGAGLGGSMGAVVWASFYAFALAAGACGWVASMRFLMRGPALRRVFGVVLGLMLAAGWLGIGAMAFLQDTLGGAFLQDALGGT